MTDAWEHVGIAGAQSKGQDKGWQEERLEQVSHSSELRDLGVAQATSSQGVV